MKNMSRSIFAGMKGRALFAVLLFFSMTGISSVCSAANGCISGTPIFTIVASSPGVSGSNIHYSVTATGYGFKTYEIRASDAGVVKSGNFNSGQTLSGNYSTPSGSGTVTFNIKDASGNVIPSCRASINLLSSIASCTLAPADYKYSSPVKSYFQPRVPQYWGTQASYLTYFKCPTGLSYSYSINSATAGTIASGSITPRQVLYGTYSIPYNTSREQLSITFPNNSNFNGAVAYGTTTPPCNASFGVSGSLVPGANIQFDGSGANINGYRPDNYKWVVDGTLYMQGNNKNMVYDSFSAAGNHSVSLTIDDGFGASCSHAAIVSVVAPPPPPSCTVDFTINPSSNQHFGNNITFTGTSGFTTYDWYKVVNGVSQYIGTSTIPDFTPSPFTAADTTSPTIRLNATSASGASCSAQHDLSLSPPPATNCVIDNLTLDNSSLILGADKATFSADVSSTSSLKDYIWTWSVSGQTETDLTGIFSNPNGGKVKKNNYIFAGPSFSPVSSTNLVLTIADPSGNILCSKGTPISLLSSAPAPSICSSSSSIHIDCLGKSTNCQYGDKITFSIDSPDPSSAGPFTYEWVIDGVSTPANLANPSDKSHSSIDHTFNWPDTNPHNVKVVIKDKDGNMCAGSPVSKNFDLKAVPQWNEIAPNMGAVTLMILALISVIRTILLYL